MATPHDTQLATPTRGPSRRQVPRARLPALLLLPVLLLSACKISDVTGTITGLFGMGSNEVATPQFEITNGIKIQVVLHAPEGSAGTPITVHVRCSGGTNASATVVVRDSGDVSIGQTTFNEGWPAGLDCLVSQETVQGVQVANAAIQILSSTLLRADFTNV